MQLVGVICSILLLALIVIAVTSGQGVEALIVVWQRLGFVELVLAIFAVLGMQVVGAWRTQVLMHADGLPRPSLPALFRLQLVSQFMAHGAPVSGLADAAKVGMLALRFAVPFGRSLRLIAYERITGAASVIVIGIAALLAQLLLPIPRGVVQLQAAVWAAGLVGLVLLACAPMIQFRTGIKVLDKVVDAVSMLAAMLRRSSVVLKLMTAAALQLVCVAAAFLVLARAMHIDVVPQLLFAFTPCIFFVSSLPVFYMGWGAREAAVVLTIGTASSITPTEATGLSVAFGATMFFASLPGGVFWAMRPSMRKSIDVTIKNAEKLSG
jgi:hypothetical protein